ncbi:MAG TPA: sigma-54 dependent transcriptional regulator [Pseudolabrys sp.]|nr:sigma-54 dependent transcriptional regulator [Pseudolabrys sp.]
MAETVLIVDDDPAHRRHLDGVIQGLGYQTIAVESGDKAVSLLMRPQAAAVDAIVLDLVMPDLDGLGVLARMREQNLRIPVIVQAANGGIDNIASAMRTGATDFVIKPATLERLQVSLRNAFRMKSLADRVQRLNDRREDFLSLSDVITNSPAMQSVLQAAQKAAASVIPVLIEGEPGAGKELIARAIHGSGKRHDKPFVVIDSRNLLDNAIAPLLFGGRSQAFADDRKVQGHKLFETDGRTILLKDIGALPASAQLHLLEVCQRADELQTGELPGNVRIICTTIDDMLAEVKAKRFREDLFYRLDVFRISVPPLRARSEDIPRLAQHFLTRFAAEDDKRIRFIDEDALGLLQAYHWPGNVRQLKNAIHRAVRSAKADRIGIDAFSQIAAHFDSCPQPAENLIEPAPPLAVDRRDLHEAVSPEAMSAAASALPLTDASGEVRPLADIERDAILFAISHYRGQMSEVARKLKIGRSTLYRKLDALQMHGT